MKENRDRPEHRRARNRTNGCEARDALHNSGEAVAVESRWVARRLFAANSTAIGNKNNAADRPSPADHRSQGVVQIVPNSVNTGVLQRNAAKNRVTRKRDHGQTG